MPPNRANHVTIRLIARARYNEAMMTTPDNTIGLLNEKPLHAALKEWVAVEGDAFEVNVDGYIIDIVSNGCLLEIQTGSCAPLKAKLRSLTVDHPTRLIIPIAREKWLLKLPKEGDGKPTRRKSPRKGHVAELFRELVSFPDLLCHPNFTVEVLLIQEEEVRRYDPNRRWRRRKWLTEERRLLDVVDRHHFTTPHDLMTLIHKPLPSPFTTAHLAKAMDVPRWLAQKAAFCLRHMDVIAQVGKQGNAYLYTIAPDRA